MPSEQLPKKEIEEPNKKLLAFRKEIEGYINDYKDGKIKGTMYDLSLITDVNDLEKEDYWMWQRVNKDNYEENPIPSKLLDYYQKQVKISKSPSRDNFRAYIIQKITWLSSLNTNIKKEEDSI